MPCRLNSFSVEALNAQDEQWVLRGMIGAPQTFQKRGGCGGGATDGPEGPRWASRRSRPAQSTSLPGTLWRVSFSIVERSVRAVEHVSVHLFSKRNELDAQRFEGSHCEGLMFRNECAGYVSQILPMLPKLTLLTLFPH
jgi:hypothetical protein